MSLKYATCKYATWLAGITALTIVLLPAAALADSVATVTGTLPTNDTFGLTIEAANVVGPTNNILGTDFLTGLSGAFNAQFTVPGSTVPNAVLIAGQDSAGLNSCGFNPATNLGGYSFLPFCSFFGGFTTQSDGSLVATFNIWEAATTVFGTNGQGNGTPVEIGSGTITITQGTAVVTPEPATLSLTFMGLLALAVFARKSLAWLN